MKAFILKVYAAIKAALVAYPGGTAAALGVIVALAANFGLHVTVAELTAIFAVFVAAAGVFVHVTTVAKAKVKK